MDSSTKQERIEFLDGGKLRVAAGFAELLRANKLDTFEQVMAHSGGQMKRSVPGRSTVRIELNAPGGGKTVAFLKRYERDYLPHARKLLRFLHWPGADDEAMHEWNAIAELRRHGFNTPTPMAVGQQKGAGAVTRSFLLTANIENGTAAHDYTRKLTAGPRRELALEIGRLTRRFLDAGFAHRDYYLSHIFVVDKPASAEAHPHSTPAVPLSFPKGGEGRSEEAQLFPAQIPSPQPSLRSDGERESASVRGCAPGAGRDLFLIDLQRVFKPRCFRRRWMVKDLASLGYTAQLAHATRADLLSFYKVCFNVKRLASSDKSLIREIMARVQSLHQRGPRYDVIWDKPGVRPPNV